MHLESNKIFDTIRVFLQLVHWIFIAPGLLFYFGRHDSMYLSALIKLPFQPVLIFKNDEIAFF